MRWKYRSALEIGSILFVVWVSFVLILLFLEVYIIPLQLPIIGYVGRVITGIIKAATGVGLFITWLFVWNHITKTYFKTAMKKSEITSLG